MTEKPPLKKDLKSGLKRPIPPPFDPENCLKLTKKGKLVRKVKSSGQ